MLFRQRLIILVGMKATGKIGVLTLPEAARALGIAQRTLRSRHYARGVGTRLGHWIVFTPADMDLLRSWPYRPGSRDRIE